jgi:hypothetical protein
MGVAAASAFVPDSIFFFLKKKKIIKVTNYIYLISESSGGGDPNRSNEVTYIYNVCMLCVWFANNNAARARGRGKNGKSKTVHVTLLNVKRIDQYREGG